MQKFIIFLTFIVLQMQICNFNLCAMDNYTNYQNQILATRIAKNKEIALEKIYDPENTSDFFKCYGWLKIIAVELKDINIIIDELLPINFTCTKLNQLPSEVTTNKRKKKNKKKHKATEEETKIYKKVLMYFNYRFHDKVSSLKICCSPPSDGDKRLTLKYLTKKYRAKLENLDPIYKNFFIKYQ